MPWYEAVGTITAISLVFAFVHSLFVADAVKDLYRRILGETFVRAFYRLAYTFFSVLTTLAAIYLITRVPDVHIYGPPWWLRWPMHAVQLLGVLIAMSAFRFFDALEFMGIRQAWRYVRKAEPEGDIEGIRQSGLIRSGVYGVVRNPMYLGAILVFTFNPYVTRTWLTVGVLADLYLVFGALMEQKRLVRRFGSEYFDYMKEVPLLIPGAGALVRVIRRLFGAQ
jgi:protein-S-isoprenylcysteine O-methyltransferase Ste14